MKGVMAMLIRTDPFREVDRLVQQALGAPVGTWNRPAAMPLDAYRTGDEYVVEFDLPGVDPGAIDLQVERDVLTVKAERQPVRPVDAGDHDAELQVAERPHGVFSRQLFLGDALDAEHISADYEAGVLTLRIPVAERAKPRTISISAGRSGDRTEITA